MDIMVDSIRTRLSDHKFILEIFKITLQIVKLESYLFSAKFAFIILPFFLLYIRFKIQLLFLSAKRTDKNRILVFSIMILIVKFQLAIQRTEFFCHFLRSEFSLTIRTNFGYLFSFDNNFPHFQ